MLNGKPAGVGLETFPTLQTSMVPVVPAPATPTLAVTPIVKAVISVAAITPIGSSSRLLIDAARGRLSGDMNVSSLDEADANGHQPGKDDGMPPPRHRSLRTKIWPS